MEGAAHTLEETDAVMGKIGRKLFYRIGEVCRICEIEPHVLRYWESEFKALKPAKNRAGQRIYREKDLKLIEKIKFLLYEEGYTISGANKRVQGEGRDNPATMPLFSGARRVSKKRALSSIRQDLEEIEKIVAGWESRETEDGEEEGK